MRMIIASLCLVSLYMLQCAAEEKEFVEDNAGYYCTFHDVPVLKDIPAPDMSEVDARVKRGDAIVIYNDEICMIVQRSGTITRCMIIAIADKQNGFTLTWTEGEGENERTLCTVVGSVEGCYLNPGLVLSVRDATFGTYSKDFLPQGYTRERFLREARFAAEKACLDLNGRFRQWNCMMMQDKVKEWKKQYEKDQQTRMAAFMESQKEKALQHGAEQSAAGAKLLDTPAKSAAMGKHDPTTTVWICQYEFLTKNDEEKIVVDSDALLRSPKATAALENGNVVAAYANNSLSLWRKNGSNMLQVFVSQTKEEGLQGVARVYSTSNDGMLMLLHVQGPLSLVEKAGGGMGADLTAETVWIPPGYTPGNPPTGRTGEWMTTRAKAFAEAIASESLIGEYLQAYRTTYAKTANEKAKTAVPQFEANAKREQEKDNAAALTILQTGNKK